ncbi:MAG: GNAT family N-acetyltransferase [Bacteroidetes bacterium]|nr:GNAT family N-acetyltransferase [Bacteroidota bacterium]
MPKSIFNNAVKSILSWTLSCVFKKSPDGSEKAIENSMCFGLFMKDNTGNISDSQVGFARLVTDKATFAYLADVFILKQHRGKGLSKWLMHVIQSHPALQQLRRWLLTTKDAHGLYEQTGWVKVPDDYVYRFMMRHNPDVYKNKEGQ